MSLLLATAGESVALSDTFLMARRHTVWPVLNTAETGTWAWSGDSGKMFGGTYTNTSNTANDSFSLENLNLFSATAAINLLYTKASTGGLCDVYWGTKGEAGDLLATIDMYAASTQKNQVAQFSLGTVTKARKALHFVMRSGTGGGYTCQIQQAEVVQLTGSNLGTSIDDLPWWVDVPPFAYSNASGSVTLTQDTGASWGSQLKMTTGLNGWIEEKVGLYPGTFEFHQVFTRFTSRGISTISIDGSDVGTIDQYGSLQANFKGTASGISIDSAGIKTVRLTSSTKNASSGGYEIWSYWQQFRKTAAHGAITATGATYGRETMELWPWFADTKSGFDTFQVQSNHLFFGIYYASSPAIGNSLHFETSVLPGTYGGESTGESNADRGIVHVSLDGGADLTTFDAYAATLTRNLKITFSASLTGGELDLSVDSKRAAATNYYYTPTQIRLTRTGA